METSKAKLKAKIVFKINNFIAILPYHILVMSGVAIISFIFNKWIEAILFLTAFFSLRYKFPTTFHSKSIVYCMIITNSMFMLSIVLCPYTNAYVFGALVFAYLDTFILWFIQSKEILKQDKECAEWFARELIFQLGQYQNPKDELLLKCKKANLSKRDTEIAVKYYIEKMSPKDIWIWLSKSNEYETIEWDSVHQLLWRIGKKIK